MLPLVLFIKNFRAEWPGLLRSLGHTQATSITQSGLTQIHPCIVSVSSHSSLAVFNIARLPVQTVGHADLFTDTAGNWWGVALATRNATVNL